MNPSTPSPTFLEYDDPEYRLFMIQRKRWKGAAARVMENFVDLGHFAWIHDGILGDRSQPITPEVSHAPGRGDAAILVDNIPDKTAPFVHRRSYRLYAPWTLHMRKEEDRGKAKVYFAPHTAHSSNETTEYMVVVRNYDLDAADVVHGPVIIKDKEIQAEVMDDSVKDLFQLHGPHLRAGSRDRRKTAARGASLDLAEELHIKGPDAVALAYRRMLGELGVEA